ncbi:hypothetical protein BJY52DRAFT_274177 [Lactarius psammicola]|nr:hypothetical protein BJY52DRAFT_274177 [Lactarius psammicola]
MDFSHNGHLQFVVPTPSSQNGHSPSSASSRGSDPSSGTGPFPQVQPLPQPPQLSTYLPRTPHTPAPIFRAPAHKHAHHLHSIPPREKSTRTLIIDHLLWVHARTRFTQARAELAMTDRTGGPGSPNYVHRERPELWDEDEEVHSDDDGADAGGQALHARSGAPEQSRDEEEARIARRDLPFARRLRQRAEALEKVVTGMLKQPPRDYPFPADEPIAPMPPQHPHIAPSAPAPSPVGKHVLPNGVRLRLALTTVTNDFFSRQPPVYRQLRVQAASAVTSSSTSRSDPGPSASRRTARSSSSSGPPSTHLSWLPQSLVPLLSVSSAAASVAVSSSPHLPSNLTHPAIQQQPYSVEPRSRVRDMFAAGVDRSSSSSPRFVRCPRHLHRACEICVTPGRTAPPRTGSDHRANERAPVAQGWGISGFSEGAGVGSGLAWPGLGGSLLRRGIPPPDEARSAPGAKNTQLAELLPRFLRLSALVALELGQEVSTTTSAGDIGAKALVPTAEWYLLLAGLLTCAVLEGYLTAGWTGLAPMQVLLGVGLGSAVTPEASPLTANDEYNEFEPDDMPDLPDAINVLFPSRSVNTIPSENGYDVAGGANGGSDLTGSGGSGSGRRGLQGSDPRVGGGGGEAEFSHEMGQRVARFLDVPAGTPDLSTHMEQLAWRYPAEPVERAALRFCEALARWRGKPELETVRPHHLPTALSPSLPPSTLALSLVLNAHIQYKKRPSTLDHPRIPTMPEGGIAGGANAGVRRAIGRYFVIPRATAATSTTAVVATSPSNSDSPAAVPVSDGGRRRANGGGAQAFSLEFGGDDGGTIEWE